jgi:hypothetical protein
MEPAGLSPPIVLGHGNAGWVEATGDFVATVAPGDGVLLYPAYSCGPVRVPCRRGNDVHCRRHQFPGLTVDGGFADFVLVSERSVVKLPAGGDRSGRRGPHRAAAPEGVGSGASWRWRPTSAGSVSRGSWERTRRSEATTSRTGCASKRKATARTSCMTIIQLEPRRLLIGGCWTGAEAGLSFQDDRPVDRRDRRVARQRPGGMRPARRPLPRVRPSASGLRRRRHDAASCFRMRLGC